MKTTSPSADPLAQPLQSIERLITNGKLEDAAKNLKVLLSVTPKDARVHLMACRLAEAGGQLQASVDAARNAVALLPGWSVAVTELAMAHARANQFPEALAAAAKAVELDPRNPALLARVIDVAHRAQATEVALAWLQRLHELTPANREVQHLIARDLRTTGRAEVSVAVYGELLATDPTDPAARLGRLQAALDAGQTALAQQDAAALLARSPAEPVYRFWNELAHGRTPDRQPAALVAQLYDGVAPIWDQHIVATLKYKLPKLVAERITAWHPALDMNLLDLGCGTGLLGACLGPAKGAIVGVDVSRAMVDLAARHNVYDKFHLTDLNDALRETPEGLYGVVAALDVFIYSGALATAIPDACRILQPGGRFIFSCETATGDEADGVLRKTMRFAHRQEQVEALCRSAGFDPVEVEQLPLRYEGSEQVQGFLVTARKPG